PAEARRGRGRARGPRALGHEPRAVRLRAPRRHRPHRRVRRTTRATRAPVIRSSRMSTTGDRLRTLVRVAAEDAVLAVLALPTEPKKALAAIEKRRADAYESAARGGHVVDAAQLDLWLAIGTRALVGVG